MRILFVTLDVPFPPERGQRMRNWALLRVLVELRHDVTLISFASPKELGTEHPALQGLCKELILVPLPGTNRSRLGSYFERLMSLVSRLPHGARRFRSPVMQNAIRSELRREPYDLVLWDEVYNLVNLLPDLKVPIVLNSHDLMHVIWGRYVSIAKNPLKRLYAKVEYAKLLRWEPQVCSQVSGVLACSGNDATLYKNLCPGLPVTVGPNSVDTRDYQATTLDDGATVLFAGGMDWFPNLDAVEYFVAEILPELRRLPSHFEFVVAGKVSDKIRQRFIGEPNMRFAGFVPDMRIEIAKAAVCIVPLRVGSGVRWKILEAGAMGKAIVSTTIGAEGLEFVDGTEILLADDPILFAKAIATLLVDSDRRRSLGAGARKRVEEQYDFESLRKSVREAIGKTVKRKLATDQDNSLIPVPQPMGRC